MIKYFCILHPGLHTFQVLAQLTCQFILFQRHLTLTGNPIKHNLPSPPHPPLFSFSLAYSVYNGLLIKSLSKSDSLLHIGVHLLPLLVLLFSPSSSSLSQSFFCTLFRTLSHRLSVSFFLFLITHKRTQMCTHSSDVQQQC